MARAQKRLVGPTQLGVTNTAESSLCTPASSTKVIMRYIKATNTDPSTTHYLCVAIGADVAANRVIDQIPILGGAEYERWILWNIESADILCASADTGSKIALTMNGDLYTLD